MISFFLSAAALGFFSGGHCLGMCGPLVLALPVSGQSHALSVFYRVAYNAGRIFTYTALGAAVGFAGAMLSLRGLQAKISYIAGALLIVFSLFQLLHFFQVGFFASLHGRLLRLFKMTERFPGAARFFMLGSINGLLPCGMVTAALAASLAAGALADGAGYMFFFGLGTFPVMLAASLFGVYLSPAAKRVLAFAGPLYGIALGLLLLLRPSLLIPHCH